jgi:hypothetical protein
MAEWAKRRNLRPVPNVPRVAPAVGGVLAACNPPSNPLMPPVLGQIALVVRDVPAATAFYRDVLGLRHPFDAGPNLSFLATGAVRVILTTSQGHGAAGSNYELYSVQ